MSWCVHYHSMHYVCAGIRHQELAQLMVLLSPLVNWFGLGTQLGIYYHELKKIELEERGSVDRCLLAVLQRWMHEMDDVKICGGATKETLVSALKDLDEIALSEVVAQSTLGNLKACISIIMFVHVQCCILSASVYACELTIVILPLFQWKTLLPLLAAK